MMSQVSLKETTVEFVLQLLDDPFSILALWGVGGEQEVHLLERTLVKLWRQAPNISTR